MEVLFLEKDKKGSRLGAFGAFAEVGMQVILNGVWTMP